MTNAPPRQPPPLVQAATAAAVAAGFRLSSTVETGRLLRAVAAAKPAGRVAESGTGHGVGTAWLHSGLGAAATLVTVEADPDRADSAAALFADDPRVRVLCGDWRLLESHAPFDVFFCDGGGKRDDPAGVVDLLAPGGVLVLDDFTPSASWPPLFEGAVDDLRVWYLTHPLLVSAEVQVGPGQANLVCTRR